MLIIVTACILILILAFAVFSTTTYLLFKKDKKTIIILPGLFASGLYDTETGMNVWDPFDGLDVSFGELMDLSGDIIISKVISLVFNDVVSREISNLFDNNCIGNEQSVLNKMAMGTDGTPINKNVKPIPWSSEGRHKYGVVNAQKGIYESIRKQYGDYYEVQVFNYDFRLDNRKNAELLEDYINSNGYTDVILMAHSNGGQVAAIYLANSKRNRDKVSKYISYNSPYYGSFSAISILENVDDMLLGAKNALIENHLSFIADKIDAVFENQFKLLLNMWTVYQLLPSYELLMQEYNGEKAGIYIDNQRVEFEDKNDLWDFYCSRPWAKNAEGNLQAGLAQWLEYNDALTVTMPNGEKVMSTTLVDTTYFNGTDILGANKAFYTKNADDTLTHS